MNYKIFTDSYLRGDLAGKLAHQISAALGIRKLSKHSRLRYYCTHKKNKIDPVTGNSDKYPRRQTVSCSHHIWQHQRLDHRKIK